jgi:hypothetical protein
VGVTVGVLVSVAVGRGVTVGGADRGVGVAKGVGVGKGVSVPVGVLVGTGVPGVMVGVGVRVGRGVGVCVGRGVPTGNPGPAVPSSGKPFSSVITIGARGGGVGRLRPSGRLVVKSHPANSRKHTTKASGQILTEATTPGTPLRPRLPDMHMSDMYANITYPHCMCQMPDHAPGAAQAMIRGRQ